jgi:hypothetical protein
MITHARKLKRSIRVIGTLHEKAGENKKEKLLKHQ